MIEEINQYIEYKSSKKKKSAFVAKGKSKTALKNQIILDESFDFDAAESKNVPNQVTGDQDDEQNPLKKDIWDGIECEVSYYFFYKTNIIRILLRYITRHPMFENCIVVIIVASSSKLVMDTYFMNEDESNIVV